MKFHLLIKVLVKVFVNMKIPRMPASFALDSRSELLL